jgi:hypothetical protein
MTRKRKGTIYLVDGGDGLIIFGDICHGLSLQNASLAVETYKTPFIRP